MKRIVEACQRAAVSERGLNHQYEIDQEVYDYIARMSSGDVRYAYNCLELATIYAPDTHITLEIIQELFHAPICNLIKMKINTMIL